MYSSGNYPHTDDKVGRKLARKKCLWRIISTYKFNFYEIVAKMYPKKGI